MDKIRKSPQKSKKLCISILNKQKIYVAHYIFKKMSISLKPSKHNPAPIKVINFFLYENRKKNTYSVVYINCDNINIIACG